MVLIYNYIDQYDYNDKEDEFVVRVNEGSKRHVTNVNHGKRKTEKKVAVGLLQGRTSAKSKRHSLNRG